MDRTKNCLSSSSFLQKSSRRDPVALQAVLTEFHWCDAGLLFEDATEMWRAFKTAVESNAGNAIITLEQ